jgi:hypothetical protein
VPFVFSVFPIRRLKQRFSKLSGLPLLLFSEMFFRLTAAIIEY